VFDFDNDIEAIPFWQAMVIAVIVIAFVIAPWVIGWAELVLSITL